MKIVFFSTSDSSIVKKTQPIRVYKNLYSPIIEEKFQVSLNEKPQLEDKYFIDNSSKNTLSAIDFLDIGLPNESTHLYDEEKYREIRQILQSDLVCYFLYTLSSLKVTDLSFALKVPFWLTINIDKIEQSDFEYTYDMSTKAFINLSVKLNISGKALGMFPFSVILNFEMKNYKIIGAFTRDSSYKTILNDRKRILLGNFLSLVPIDEDSYYHLDFKANFANLINYNIKYYYFLNGDGNLGTASDMWATGENAGFWIPCYNLNGKEFTEKVLDINSYSEEKQADEISNLLKTKNIEPIIVPTDFKEKFKFYLKKDFLNKFKEFKKDENAFCFENLAQKVIFINMMSCENNKDWKTLQINLEEPSIVLSLPYYQFLSRLNFNLINENKLNVKIIFNKCFKFNNDYDSFTINLVNDNNLFIVD
ncbi:MAG: hypothetical protein LBF02_00080 [Mycoplasmataceae bacterium]|nr:hypothetical protein [Mycoplasmataceae bacterium]